MLFKKCHYFFIYRDKQEVLNAIGFYPDRGRTNTQDALSLLGREMFSTSRGARQGVADIAILVTDGYSNVNEQNTVPEATRLKDNDKGTFRVF